MSNKPDHKLIVWWWAGLILCAALHVLNGVGWALGVVPDRVNNAITNQLSWIALEVTAAGALVAAYAKRDVNT